MGLFKQVALSFLILPSMAMGMEKGASESFGMAEFETILKNKGNSSFVLSKNQVDYLNNIKPEIKDFFMPEQVNHDSNSQGLQLLQQAFRHQS